MEIILDSKIISKYISKESLKSYERDFDKWILDFNMRKYIGTFDHFGIKVEDENALIEVCEAIKPYCVDKKGVTPGLSIRNMHDRKIAVAILKNPIEFKNQLIDCVEIIQPRPEKERDYEIIGIDHLEIITPHLNEVEKVLQENAANYYVDQTNRYKKITVSFINDKNERLKFTNKSLEEIVPRQISDEPEKVKILF